MAAKRPGGEPERRFAHLRDFGDLATLPEPSPPTPERPGPTREPEQTANDSGGTGAPSADQDAVWSAPPPSKPDPKLASDRTEGWQCRLPGELHARLGDARYELRMRDLVELSDAQFIVGGLIACCVNVTSRAGVAALVRLVSDFSTRPVSLAPNDQRFSGNLPRGVKDNLYASLERVRADAQHRRDRSIRFSQQRFVQALIWRYVEPGTPEAMDWLVAHVLTPYLEAVYPLRAQALSGRA